MRRPRERIGHDPDWYVPTVLCVPLAILGAKAAGEWFVEMIWSWL